MPDMDPEIDCLQAIYTAFMALPDDAARDRALSWLKDRHEWDQDQRRRAASK